MNTTNRQAYCKTSYTEVMNVNIMQHLKARLTELCERYSIEIDRYYTLVLWVLVAVLVWGIGQLLYKPIHAEQKAVVTEYQTQQLYPYTHELAEKLLQQDTPIRQHQYFYMLRVLHFEQRRIRFQEDDDTTQ